MDKKIIAQDREIGQGVSMRNGYSCAALGYDAGAQSKGDSAGAMDGSEARLE